MIRMIYRRALLLVVTLLFMVSSVVASPLLSQVEQRIAQIHSADDLTPLSALASQYPLVLLGESTHGTQEFYDLRAQLSKTLIEQHRYRLLAIEAPWSFVLKINAYIQGTSKQYASAKTLLSSFGNWPEWMLNNQVTADFIEWLRRHNQTLPKTEQVAFLGLDLYEADSSIMQLLDLIKQHAPQLYPWVQNRLTCFTSAQETQWQAAADRGDFSCHQQLDQVRQVLSQMRHTLDPYQFDYLSAQQHAQVIYHAELFYRFNRSSQTRSWNVRSWHLWQTLLRLMDWQGGAKALVWAHNTHIADSSASPPSYAPGSITLGYLAKQHQSSLPVFSVGFATYQGQVLAGDAWGAEQAIMTLPKAKSGSYEHLLSQLDMPQFYWIFTQDDRQHPVFNRSGVHRAVGVVYDPADETDNYLPTALPWRYDALIFVKDTSALVTLD